jgi:hypothetical protein
MVDTRDWWKENVAADAIQWIALLGATSRTFSKIYLLSSQWVNPGNNAFKIPKNLATCNTEFVQSALNCKQRRYWPSARIPTSTISLYLSNPFPPPHKNDLFWLSSIILYRFVWNRTGSL